VSVICFILAAAVFPQTRKKPAAKPAPALITVEPTPAAQAPVNRTQKKNERPGQPVKAADARTEKKDEVPEYYYEFTQPDFPVSRVVIKHNAAGQGTVSFQRSGLDEMITESFTLSSDVMDRLNSAITALNFLDSTENYQYERDYPHLGNVTIRITRGGRARTVKFNWTLNKDAKSLYDDYRRIGNQYIWKFDINVARENQPLDGPRLMDQLEQYINRGEIADPRSLIPLLNELTQDERIPLIARNHAGRLVAKIEKSKK
jgi:hypothetical protein